MSSTDPRDELRIVVDSDDDRDDRHWVAGLFFLGMAGLYFSMVFDHPASIFERLTGVLFGCVGFGGPALLMLLLPPKRSNLTLSHFDFFGRIDPTALAGERGPLAIAARVLEKNRAALKGQFTVVTAAGRDRDRFPMGRGDFPAHRYVALASNREPIALFFYPGFVSSLLIHEYHYSVQCRRHDDGEEYFYPVLRVMRSDGRSKRLGALGRIMGEGVRRALRLEYGRKPVRMRLWRHQVTTENVHTVIDQFVARYARREGA